MAEDLASALDVSLRDTRKEVTLLSPYLQHEEHSQCALWYMDPKPREKMFSKVGEIINDQLVQRPGDGCGSFAYACAMFFGDKSNCELDTM